jgi:hypothetical protein
MLPRRKAIDKMAALDLAIELLDSSFLLMPHFWRYMLLCANICQLPSLS